MRQGKEEIWKRRGRREEAHFGVRFSRAQGRGKGGGLQGRLDRGFQRGSFQEQAQQVQQA